MAAPKGNRFGVDCETFVKPKSYNPEEWVKKFVEYLEYMDEKVWNVKHPIKGGDMAGTVMDVPVSTPLSIRSFCVFAGISVDTFSNYEKSKGYEDYFGVTTRMRTVIEANQLEGATVGAYNANIVARLLGLAEKTLHGIIKEQPIFPDLNKPDGVSENDSD